MGEISIQAQTNSEKKTGILSNPMFWRLILAVFCLIAAFLTQFYVRKPNFGTFLASDMDAQGNVYILGVFEKKNQYRISKIDSKGVVVFQKTLEAEESGSYSYRGIEVDSKGNFFLVREIRDKNALVSNPSLLPIINETVFMYDQNGTRIKKAVEFNFSDTPDKPTKGYIRKVQIINQKLSIIGANKNTFELTTINPFNEETPVKEYAFEVESSTILSDYSSNWVNDIAALSNNKIYYSTKNGDFFSVESDGFPVNCRSILPNERSSVVSMSVDGDDNLYFTDILSGVFYKMDTKTLGITSVYGLEDSIKNSKFRDYKIRDFRRIRSINVDDYYAASKDFENPFHVRLGSSDTVISNLRGAFWPWGLIYTFVGGILLFLLIILVVKTIQRGVSRMPLALRITGMFLPALILLMSFLVYASATTSSRDYGEALRSHQMTGAKIIAEKINGDALKGVSESIGDISEKFTELNISMHMACDDLEEKVGDKSDYVVIYFFKDGKIYSAMNNKYEANSNSFSELRFADPDMVSSEVALSDCLLERNELSSLQTIWDSLRNKDKTSGAANFNDVRGKLSACFAPIKTSSGEVIGIAGNFLDEKIHVSDEFYKIFINSVYLVGLISVIVFSYLSVVVWYAFRPMRILEKGIDAMICGNWKTQVDVRSKDEIQDIAIAFNNMSSRLDTYTGNLMELNEEYLRFVPKDLLKLMGKERITEVKAGDCREVKAAIIYITFNIKWVEAGVIDESEKILFDFYIKGYSEIFDIVEKNKGIVQNFSGLGATVIFSGGVENAIGAARQINGSIIEKNLKKDMQISLGFGSMLIGVIGNENRCGISVVADEMVRMINIDHKIEKIGSRFVATESFVKTVPATANFKTRLLGRISDFASVNNQMLIYEVIESPDIYKKELYENTKNIFENAVNSFMASDFEDARKMFTDIIKINEDDKTAIYYLNRCDALISTLKLKEGRDFDIKLF
jgi:hypothetical protein